MELWNFIKEKLDLDNQVVLLTIIDSNGSSPGKPGFKMAVCKDGSTMGTVGGGKTEFTLTEKAEALLDRNLRLPVLEHVRLFNEDDSARPEDSCTGELWVALYPTQVLSVDLISELSDVSARKTFGLLRFDQEGVHFTEGEQEHHSHAAPVMSPEEWHLEEVFGRNNAIYIFGAGHVGLALSQIMKQLGFDIYVFDDRPGFPLLRDNNYATEKKIIDFETAFEIVPDSDNTYAVVMTYGHKSDESILRQLLPKKIKYLGWMASRKRVARIFTNLEDAGFSKAEISKIDAPIGLPIGSQTASEIAISIAAKIVAVKYEV